MFESKEFKAMQSSMDALWLKQKIISQNLANYETPGYKAKSVKFEDVMSEASKRYDFRAAVITEENTEVRPDGNNVDLEKENLELYRTYLQSAYLSQKISGQISTMRYVLSQSFK